MSSPVLASTLLDQSVWRGRYFDGAWKQAPNAITVREPATGGELGVAGGGTPEVAIELTERAPAAKPAWARTSADDRARVMREAARIIEANAPEITEWIIRETGGVPAKAGYEVAIAVG